MSLIVSRMPVIGHHRKEKQLITWSRANQRSITAWPALLNEFTRSLHPARRQSRLNTKYVFQKSFMKPGIFRLIPGSDIEGTDTEGTSTVGIFQSNPGLGPASQ